MSSRHQLVVLGIISGSNFPSGGGKFLIRGQLGGVWLVSEEMETASTQPSFDKQLAWEVTTTQLRQCRSRKVMLRVEVWRDKDMLGHLMMDLRSAVPLESKNEKASVKSFRLIGSAGACLKLSLGLEQVESISHDISEEDMETNRQVDTPRTQQPPTLSPVLMENDDGSGGYFLIGEKSLCHQKFSLSICLVFAENLHLVPAKGLVLQDKDPFYFQYDLLGVDISTEQFFSLEKPEFVSEKATAMIISNQDHIRQFLATAGVSIKLCHGATVLGAAEVELGHVLPDNGHLDNRLSFQGNVDMVAAHNLAVPVDEEGKKARIGVMMVLEREEMNLSTGRLSDVEMEEDVEGINIININEDKQKQKDHEKTKSNNDILHESIDNEENENSMNEESQQPPLPITNSQSVRPPSPPTKLPHSGITAFPPHVIPHPMTVSQPTPTPPQAIPSTPICHPTPLQSNPADTTDYLSPPPPPATKPYKLSVEIKTIHLTDPSISYTDCVLAYKYLALHKEVIATPSFSLEGDKVTVVPGGYCQFSFAVQEEKMKQTFGAHLLKVGLYVGGQMRLKASVNLSTVACGGTWSGKVDMVGSEGVLGHVQVDLLLEQGEKKPAKVIETQSANMLAMAARELETWKMEQKKKFNDSLVQVEVQHLTLLGKEWREREKERERVTQEQSETIKVLEQELRQELEKMEVQKREMDEGRRSVDNERERLEREKLDLTNEKGAFVEKLKLQMREKDAEVAVKKSEIDNLAKKLDAVRVDVEKRTFEKNASRLMDGETKAELAQLRAEKTTWKASMEQAGRVKRFYMENCEQLRKQVVELQVQKEKTYSDQIAGLELQVKDLSRKLVEKTKVPTNIKNAVEVTADPAKNAETQTPQVQPVESESLTNSNSSEEAAGLARLEENLSMLLRTGVYRETDHVVVKLTEQIEKKREKLRLGNGR